MSKVFDNTPTVVVVIAPTVTGGVLTIRRAVTDGYGRFALPGGYQERPESLEGAGAREFLEETGISIDPAKLSLVKLVTTPDGAVNLAFYQFDGKVSVETAVLNPEVLEFSDTPCPTNLAFPLHTQALKAYFERTT